MKRAVGLVSVLMVFAFVGSTVLAQCPFSRGKTSCSKTSTASVDKVLCTGCGQVKGSDECCNPDAAKCTKCELAKGSPGCCKISAADKAEKTVTLCGKCNQIKGGDSCCKGDTKCCSNAGSDKCCKAGK